MITYILNEDDHWVEGEPTESGQPYKIEYENGSSIQSIYSIPPPELPSYSTDSESVKINGNPATGKASVYFAVKGDSLTITANLVDGDGNIQTQIDQTALGHPPMLMLPLVKVAGNTIVDEVYVLTTINAGVIESSGEFPSGGNWQLTQDRVNASLAEIYAEWQIKIESIQFRVA